MIRASGPFLLWNMPHVMFCTEREGVQSLPVFLHVPSTKEIFPVMIPDLSPFFIRYEALVKSVDAVFEQVARTHATCVKCHSGCSDCCHALFDLSLIEALYLNTRFKERFSYGAKRSAILTEAAAADRRITVLKRDYFRTMRDKGREVVTEEAATEAVHDVMEQVAHDRVRCPLLGADDTCLMYEERPITCRLYGIPTEIEGKAHVCGKSGFLPGTPYPTVHLGKIQDRLDELSLDVQNAVQSRFKELHKVYVPVSMALLTNYDEKYLGIGPAPDPRKEF